MMSSFFHYKNKHYFRLKKNASNSIRRGQLTKPLIVVRIAFDLALRNSCDSFGFIKGQLLDHYVHLSMLRI